MSSPVSELPPGNSNLLVSPPETERKGLTKKELAADHPTWCPGCGDFSVLALYFKLIEKRKAADLLETRLRGIRLDVLPLEQDQKDSDQAAQYLHGSDPESAITALQARITSTEQAVQFHQQRNQSGDLIGRVEEMRQQQQEIKTQAGRRDRKKALDRGIDLAASKLPRRHGADCIRYSTG